VDQLPCYWTLFLLLLALPLLPQLQPPLPLLWLVSASHWLPLAPQQELLRLVPHWSLHLDHLLQPQSLAEAEPRLMPLPPLSPLALLQLRVLVVVQHCHLWTNIAGQQH
jgi:hypothetical protein